MKQSTRKKEKEKSTETVKNSLKIEEGNSGKKVDDNFLFRNGLPRWYSNEKIKVDFLPHNHNERGVFSREDLEAFEVLEEVPFVSIDFYYQGQKIFNFLRSDPEIGSGHLNTAASFGQALGLRSVEEYMFDWSDGSGNSPSFPVIPLGNAAIYNSSPTPNAEWLLTKDSFIFRTIKEIKKGEEVRTFYGYFLTESGRKITAKKVLGMYVEINEDDRICLRTISKENANSISDEKRLQINAKCLLGDVLMNEINFYTSDKKIAATLKADQVRSADFFYEKISEAKNVTNFAYVDIQLLHVANNKKETLTLYNR